MAKFLVPLTIFLSASLGDAFVNHARLNHLIRFQQPKRDPTNEPSREPICEPTNYRMEIDKSTNNSWQCQSFVDNVSIDLWQCRMKINKVKSNKRGANPISLFNQTRQVYSHISVGCCIRLKQEGANRISLFNQILAHIPGPTILGGVGSRILKQDSSLYNEQLAAEPIVHCQCIN